LKTIDERKKNRAPYSFSLILIIIGLVSDF